MKLNKKAIAILEIARKECNAKDKSTEYMLEYMQSVAKVDLDTVLKFLMLKNFKKGQTVVIHSSHASEGNKGKIFICKDNSFLLAEVEIVHLEGLRDRFPCKLLEEVNIKEQLDDAYNAGHQQGCQDAANDISSRI